MNKRVWIYGGVGLAIAAIALTVFLVLSGTGRRGADDSDQDADASSETFASEHAAVETDETGPWDIPIPAINPLLRQTAYTEVHYVPLDIGYVDWIDENGFEQSRRPSGPVWQMKVPSGGNSADSGSASGPFAELAVYMARIGGTIRYNAGSGRVCALRTESGDKWWAVAEPDTNGYLLTVIAENALTAGKPVTFKASDYPDRILRFSTENLGDNFQSLTLEIESGILYLHAVQESRQGESWRSTDWSMDAYADKSSRFIYDDIPQQKGVTEWELSWYEEVDPGTFTLSLLEPVPLAGIPEGSQSGCLRVRGVSAGSVHVELPSGTSVEQPEFTDTSLGGDVTPEGDTLFWLPGGYWNVLFSPEGAVNMTACRSMLVPVHPGKETVFEIPPSWEGVFAQLEQTGAEAEGIRITDAQADGDTARIDFTLTEHENENMVPDRDNLQITEGGTDVEILGIERINIPSSIVLVLDSSGSMKGQMDQTLAAAKTFIESLPADANVRLVDFDTEAKVADGTTKEEALAALKQVKAGGATALYDSVMEGLGLLEGLERPALVLFTDGVDANMDDSGPGSYGTLEELSEIAAESGIPIYGIGFGPKHDNAVLLTLASLTDGRYYPAVDQDALKKVFAAISGKLGSAFRATWRRPESVASAETPVVSFMIDVSGSMDTSPDEEGCGYRIDRVKNLFHDFMLTLPPESVIQLSSFSAEVQVNQAFTTDRAALLQALGNLRVDSSTEIALAVRAALETMRPVPSANRVVVFLTDAALINGAEDESFNSLLEEIARQDIQVLWVGLGVEDSEDAFRHAAEVTGGSYVISEDASVLEEAFRQLLEKIEAPAERERTAVGLRLTRQNTQLGANAEEETDDKDDDDRDTAEDLSSSDGSESGMLAAETIYTAGTVVDFPIRKSSGTSYEIETVHSEVRETSRASLYGVDAAASLYGADTPRRDVTVLRRTQLFASGENAAMQWTATAATWMSRFRGIDAPGGKAILAVDMRLENVTSEKIPYMIPNVMAHFHFNLNNEGMVPASEATWLAEEPLMEPGEPGITLAPGEVLEGTMLFLVPDVAMKQGSLHFYDVNNGHIILPLAGRVLLDEAAISRMPQTVTGNLSDSFSMTLVGQSDLERLRGLEMPEGALFRVIEGEFSSKVQALLDLDPSERLSLRLGTPRGDFRFPLHAATKMLPFGFARPVQLAPGSQSTVRMAFGIPEALRDGASATLVMDLEL